MKIVHYPSLLLVVLLHLGADVAVAAEVVPAPFPIDRYEHIWKASPFSIATEVTPGGQTLAQRYAITGFARIAGKEIVFVFDRQSLSRFPLAMDRPQSGVSLVSMDQASNLKDMKIVVRVGSETGELRYDPSASGGGQAAQPPPPNSITMAPQGQNNQAVAQQQNSTVVNRANIPRPVPQPAKILRRTKITNAQ